MKVVNLSNENVLASDVKQAYSFLKRLKGLMFTKELGSGKAIHLKPCRSVHTFFMNYAIDVIYLGEGNKVVAINENLQPNKAGKHYKYARSVVELPVGTVSHSQTKVGDVLSINE
ncbi:DUF192 domain-containing protein [Bacillus shivajii]|uniref:DUF192 domain-containing protein n=1 Tax=Bacillus shivajii TaxID=1983719 RepID=UPI001CFBF9F5|nr:DUF192 domain-containing protein [Bacillus shivajii]UCZ53151.1 DUF192 domain-containing protein [Bacillus shivajii]